MQQRVNFVRALAIHPNLILLDEPFSALDDETKEAVIQTFKKVLDLKKIACLLVTHNEGEALKIVDQLIYLTQKPTTIKEIVAV
jgi:ABC-type nitrate/sulfonate/bicarbonate transport system ATPase subunit